jgi:hypothetical protein
VLAGCTQHVQEQTKVEVHHVAKIRLHVLWVDASGIDVTGQARQRERDVRRYV